MFAMTRKFSHLIINLSIVFVLLYFAHLQLNSYEKPSIKISKQDSAFNLSPQLVDIFSLGYRRFITAITWISTILESDHEHYKLRDSNSWMFLRFNLIATLDPNFYENYLFGGQYLSIIKDDDIGAKILLNKGMAQYPNNLELNLISGYHYLFELQDQVGAAQIYQKIINNPKTPNQIKSIYAKLLVSRNDLQSAYNILYSLYQKNKNIPLLKKKYHQYLYSIKAEIDLTCLNSPIAPRTKCNITDLEGHNYVLQNNQYTAIKKWAPLRFNNVQKN